MRFGSRVRNRIVEAERFAGRARSAELLGASNEALGWYDRALASLEGQGPSEVLADVLRWKGSVHRECGDTTEAERLYARSADIAAVIGYALGQAHVANCRAVIAQRRGALAEAAQRYSEAAVLASRAGDTRLVTMTQRNLGIIATIRGDHEEALARFALSLQHAERLNDHDGICRALNNMGIAHTQCGRFGEAESVFDRAVALATSTGDLTVECACRLSRADARVAAGNLADAEHDCRTALAIADRRGDRLRRAEGLKLLAMIWRQRGAYDTCDAILEEALDLSDAGEDALLVADLLSEKAQLSRSRKDLASAFTLLRDARALYASMGAAPQVHAIDDAIASLGSSGDTLFPSVGRRSAPTSLPAERPTPDARS